MRVYFSKKIGALLQQRAFLIAIGLSVFFGIVLYFTEFKVCFSNSLEEVHCYVMLKSSSVKRGDIVSIRGHREDHVGEMVKLPYSKRVLGVAGDKILRNKRGVWIEPQATPSEARLSKLPEPKVLKLKILPLLKRDRYGKPLTPLKARIIPEGYVFVAGDHLRSFDSRYEEFGLVPLEKIWGKAVLTW